MIIRGAGGQALQAVATRDRRITAVRVCVALVMPLLLASSPGRPFYLSPSVVPSYIEVSVFLIAVIGLVLTFKIQYDDDQHVVDEPYRDPVTVHKYDQVQLLRSLALAATLAQMQWGLTRIPLDFWVNYTYEFIRYRRYAGLLTEEGWQPQPYCATARATFVCFMGVVYFTFLNDVALIYLWRLAAVGRLSRPFGQAAAPHDATDPADQAESGIWVPEKVQTNIHLSDDSCRLRSPT